MSDEPEAPKNTGAEESVPGFDEFGAVEPDAQAELEREDYAKGDERRHEEKKQVAHWISIWVLRLFACVLCIVFLIRNFSSRRSAMLVLA